MWLIFMLIERIPVAVDLIENPCKRLALDSVRRVEQCAGLALADRDDGLSDQCIELGCLVGVGQIETDDQSEHRNPFVSAARHCCEPGCLTVPMRSARRSAKTACGQGLIL